MYNIELHSEEKFPIQYGTSWYRPSIYWKFTFSIGKKMYFNAAGLQAHFVAVFRCAFIFRAGRVTYFSFTESQNGWKGSKWSNLLAQAGSSWITWHRIHSKYDQLTDKLIRVFTFIIVLSFVTREGNAGRVSNKSSNPHKRECSVLKNLW